MRSSSETGIPGDLTGGMGHVTTKKEIIDHVVAAGHHASQHMPGSNDLSAAGLHGGQHNPLADSYLQHGKPIIFISKLIPS